MKIHYNENSRQNPKARYFTCFAASVDISFNVFDFIITNMLK